MTDLKLHEYLERIGYKGRVKPDLETLRELQVLHLRHVPFENLDIHRRIPIILDEDPLFEKIVENRRGGFCYELNGLFFELLRSIGFDATRVSARVYEADKDAYSPEFDHMAIVATFSDGAYLTDVGFGDFIHAPLSLLSPEPQEDPGGTYMVDHYDDAYLRVSRIRNGKTVPEFIFRNVPRELPEFNGMCTYHQTDSRSHFMKKPMATILTEDGRITLAGNTLKVRQGLNLTETELPDRATYDRVLRETFGISL